MTWPTPDEIPGLLDFGEHSVKVGEDGRSVALLVEVHRKPAEPRLFLSMSPAQARRLALALLTHAEKVESGRELIGMGVQSPLPASPPADGIHPPDIQSDIASEDRRDERHKASQRDQIHV